MRWVFLLLMCAGSLPAQNDLDNARVSLSYKELRSLIEAAQKPPATPPEVPVPFAVLSAEYDFAVADKTLEGRATFVVQTFKDGPQLVPLIGEGARIASIEPADSLLVVREGRYVLAVEGKSRRKITVHLSVPLREEDDGKAAGLIVPLCALSRLRLVNVAEGDRALAEGGPALERDKDILIWQLGATDSLDIAIQKKTADPVVAAVTGNRVEMPAVVRSACSEMRVVRDGSYINSMTWTVRHDGPLNWTLSMPEDGQLLACKVGGENVAPILQDAKTWVIPLPAPRDRTETRVELAYTGRETAFEPVRGEFTGTLPGTSLLVEKLEWKLQIPSPYETVAIQGNVDFRPGTEAGELCLTRELGRGDAPTVHVFYQKPENLTKK